MSLESRPQSLPARPARVGDELENVASPSILADSYAEGDVVAGKYKLVRILGEGGMGAVWLARNLALDADVALKLIRRDLVSTEASERLLQEARASARIGHSSIVRVFDFGETERGESFIVMEVLEGESFGDLLERKGRLAPLKAVCILLPVASALGAAHAKGIVHRDMKPDNVMLVPDAAGGVLPKVVDFGIARLRTEGEHRLTSVGAVMGSPDYMAPEQARGRDDVDHRADVWALTVMLYEAITGQRPFAAHNYNALMMAVILENPTPTTELAAGDAQLWAIIEKGLAKDVEQRWSSARELGSALAAWAFERGAERDAAGNSLRTHWMRASITPLANGRAASIDEWLGHADCEAAWAPREAARVTPSIEAQGRSPSVPTGLALSTSCAQPTLAPAPSLSLPSGPFARTARGAATLAALLTVAAIAFVSMRHSPDLGHAAASINAIEAPREVAVALMTTAPTLSVEIPVAAPSAAPIPVASVVAPLAGESKRPVKAVAKAVIVIPPPVVAPAKREPPVGDSALPFPSEPNY